MQGKQKGHIFIQKWSLWKFHTDAKSNFCPLFSTPGYYNGTIFHRVVPEFIIQGGDPTGTGTGGESIYGKPFKVQLLLNEFNNDICTLEKNFLDWCLLSLCLCWHSQDEFHSRLRFNRRGLVAMANAGPHDNGSQFFFSLGRADELNNKHTIFAKVKITFVLHTYVIHNTRPFFLIQMLPEWTDLFHVDDYWGVCFCVS